MGKIDIITYKYVILVNHMQICVEPATVVSLFMLW